MLIDGIELLGDSQLPHITITETYVVGSEAAMLALTAQTGDVAVRTDLNKSFILKGAAAATLADWQELLTPTDAVLSVNGSTGVVNLTSTNIAEGTNLYFTDARASASAPVQTVFGRSGAIVLTSADVTGALAFTPLNKAGDTMTGPLTLGGPPTTPLHAATKAYVDTAVASSTPASSAAAPVDYFNYTFSGGL